MNSILKDLYDGNITPSTDVNSNTEEYITYLRQICDELDYFKGILSKKDYGRLEELTYKINDANSIVNEKTFIYSFKLSARIILDILT